MTSKQNVRFAYPALGLAVAIGLILIVGSFIAAGFTQHIDTLFSLSPRVSSEVAIPSLDIIPDEKKYLFHVTIFTVWATMLLCLPAFCTVWFIRKNQTAGNYWLAFWTTGLIAMLVHLYLAMGMLFDWNWQHILEDTVRVTIPKPDLILTAWWILDVILGWSLLYSKNMIIHGQRVLLHFALLIIFLIGFIREGEILLSKVIGGVSALVVLIAVLLGFMYSKLKAI